jgi:HEAT repeat protein
MIKTQITIQAYLNYQIERRSSEMVVQDHVELENRISLLIADLHDADGLKRQKARYALIALNKEAVPALTDIVLKEKGHARWEAIEALGWIGDPEVATILVDNLRDDDVGIRWAAANALIKLGRAAVEPLLAALTEHFDSIWLRQGAHHILHTFKDRGLLYPKEVKVFEATEGIEPLVEVPWAANAALENLQAKM